MRIRRTAAVRPYAGDSSFETDQVKRGRPCRMGELVFRSSWEALYARQLEELRRKGLIAAWEYEPDTFLFDGVPFAPYSYTPDFKVTDLDGEVVYYEVKGWMDRLSKRRLRRM